MARAPKCQKLQEMRYRAIILDFDNVILESFDVKTDAFRELFNRYPERLDEIVRFHLNNKGMSRFEKFKYIYARILRQPLTEQEFEGLCDDFRQKVFERVLRSPFVPGAKEFIEHHSSRCALYVVSATPQEEIRAIVAKLGIHRYFKDVLGSPIGKADNIRRVISEGGYEPKEILFVGDARQDYEAAAGAGCDFIGRVPPGESNPFEGLPQVRGVVHDLTEIEAYL